MGKLAFNLNTNEVPILMKNVKGHLNQCAHELTTNWLIASDFSERVKKPRGFLGQNMDLFPIFHCVITHESVLNWGVDPC